MSKLPGVLKDIAQEVGPDAAEKLGRRFAGCAVKFPSERTLNIAARNKAIRQEYAGDNAAQLARKWGLSVRRINQIVGPDKR